MTVFQKAKRNCFSNRGNDNTLPTGKAKRFIQCCIVNAFKACPGMSGSIDVYRIFDSLLTIFRFRFCAW